MVETDSHVDAKNRGRPLAPRCILRKPAASLPTVIYYSQLEAGGVNARRLLEPIIL